MHLTAKPFPKVDTFYLHIAPLICWALQNKNQSLIIIVSKYVQIFDSNYKNGVKLRWKQRCHGHPMEGEEFPTEIPLVSDGDSNFRRNFRRKMVLSEFSGAFSKKFQIWFFMFRVGMRCPRFSREERERATKRERESATKRERGGARKREKAEDAWFLMTGDRKKELSSCIIQR